MAKTILLVEDDSQIREVIEDYFGTKSNGEWKIMSAKDGAEGLTCIETQEYDLVLLDVMLPEIDGFSLCRSLRKRSNVPLLFLTARGREDDILYGYELGCDDYVVKPFSLPELYAKVNAMLRRSVGMVTARVLTSGGITIEPSSYRVTVNGTEIALPPKEYALLLYFMEHPNTVISRGTLLNKVWGYDYYGVDRVVDNHIKKLRKALGDCGKQIHTVISRGYLMKLDDRLLQKLIVYRSE